MRHYYLEEKGKSSSEHWGVGKSQHNKVLVQLGDEKGKQIRLSYTKEEAIAMANALIAIVKKIEKDLVGVAGVEPAT